MIKFFRKIRQNLIAKGKTGQYLKYAFGEIVLVVIGILIALQINNWNEKRKNDNYELQLLVQLQNDLKRNTSDLEFNIILQKRAISSSKHLISHLNNNLPFHDSLLTHFSNAGLWTKFIVNAGAYKTIESKGLDLISDLELRDLIFRIYEGNLYWLQQLESTVIDQVEGFRINKAQKYFRDWNAVGITNGKLQRGNSKIIDYQNLKNSNELLYFLSSSMNQNMVLLQISEGYLDDNQQGVQMIEAILNSEMDN